MSFKNNFSEILLLSGKPTLFKNEEKSFEIYYPTVYDSLSNQDFLIFIGLMEKDVGELKTMINGYEVKSHYDFIRIISILSKREQELQSINNSLMNGLNIIMPGSVWVQQELYYNNLTIDADTFAEILIIVLKSMGKDKTVILDSDDEFTKIEKQAKLRAQKIREKSKKGDNEKGLQFEDMFAAILYEFPQYKLEDLFNMNLYTIYYLFKYIGKIINYEVSKIAAGNGLTKKHKYFID